VGGVDRVASEGVELDSLDDYARLEAKDEVITEQTHAPTIVMVIVSCIVCKAFSPLLSHISFRVANVSTNAKVLARQASIVCVEWVGFAVC